MRLYGTGRYGVDDSFNTPGAITILTKEQRKFISDILIYVSYINENGYPTEVSNLLFEREWTSKQYVPDSYIASIPDKIERSKRSIHLNTKLLKGVFTDNDYTKNEGEYLNSLREFYKLRILPILKTE